MFRKFIAALFLLITILLIITLISDVRSNPLGFSEAVFPYMSVILTIFICGFIARRLMSARRVKSGFLVMTIVVFVIGTVMASFGIAVMYVDSRLKDRQYAGVYNDCYKVWAARGYVPETSEILPDGNQNSIESVRMAFARGARGTEIDVHFDVQRGEFIVAHDRPYQLKNGAILTMEDLFGAIEDYGYIWLDFKKLRHLDDRELAHSVAELQRLAETRGIKNLIYVEGEAPFSLAAYRDAGFSTIFDTHPLADNNVLTPPIINLYKLAYYFGDFTVMAMNYGDLDNPIYGTRTRRLLADVPVFVYHVSYDEETFDMLSRLDQVRVILPLDQSMDRYHVNACGT